MSTVDQFVDDALNLPSEQRADIALRLIKSLDETEFAPDVVHAWREELLRRLESIQAGTAKMRPWEDVKQEIETARRGNATT